MYATLQQQIINVLKRFRGEKRHWKVFFSIVYRQNTVYISPEVFYRAIRDLRRINPKIFSDHGYYWMEKDEKKD